MAVAMLKGPPVTLSARPESRFQLVRSPENKRRPAWANATENGMLTPPVNRVISRPVARSQIRITPSIVPIASKRPSGLKSNFISIPAIPEARPVSIRLT